MSDMTACPHCGAEIAADANFCRYCGSSESDGWRDESESDVDDFDYEEYVADNFGTSPHRTSIAPLWRLVAFVLLVLFLLGFLFF
jgi:uncharacterized membrane protein YvbJ